jgi:N-acetylmuramoyl-L-alanine amidase
MGDRYLVELAEVCRRTGYPVVEVEGWQSRARGSGGYSSGQPSHIMTHHTASGRSSDGWSDANYCTFGDDDAPLCNIYLSRVPEIFVCAAGGTNTNGTGHDPCGRIGDDTMNSSAIGIEAGNDGVGEIWNERQQAAYVALVAELGAAYGIAPAQCHAHFEWTSRKIDCAGPSEWALSGSWNMNAFRADVELAGTTPTPPQPIPTPPEDDVSNVLILQDVRNTARYRCGPDTKSWIRDGNMSAQISMRLEETKRDGVAVDGFRYTEMSNGNVDFIRSTGPIVGPRPAGVDEYGG